MENATIFTPIVLALFCFPSEPNILEGQSMKKYQHCVSMYGEKFYHFQGIKRLETHLYCLHELVLMSADNSCCRQSYETSSKQRLDLLKITSKTICLYFLRPLVLMSADNSCCRQSYETSSKQRLDLLKITSKTICLYFLRRPKGRRSNIALDLQFMQIFTNQKYS